MDGLFTLLSLSVVMAIACVAAGCHSAYSLLTRRTAPF